MSRHVVLRMQPGETVDDFTTRVANAAPTGLSPQLTARLRSLLAIGTETTGGNVANSRPDRAAA
ncbi:hypothetical protein [Streptomyces sp. NPDC045251]|uniref:hypothetical protein n=1 Tax=unclassified Streptomyces TaxID=2593676 RepID=UPI0033F59F61